MKEREIFVEALQRSMPAERAAFLAASCGDDQTLRHAVERLLAAHAKEGRFLLDSPPPGLGDTRCQSPIAEQPGTQVGRYRLLQWIGEGGFGAVYMAEQEEPVRRKVALKIIKLGMDTKQVIARFEAERQALAMMDHPHIAKVLDAGSTETGRPYFVMELVRGDPITEYCDGNRLTTKERLKLVVDVCHAVQHAHQKGIIHRDIKPTNVMVTAIDNKPVPKVIDFGIAKATQQRLTEKTLCTTYDQLIGTPQYMSPEQAAMCDQDIDTRSDIYSLGVLLYELLVGTTPFDSEALCKSSYDQICRTIRETEPTTPSRRLSVLGPDITTVAEHRRIQPMALRKQLVGEVDWIVMKALEKDRTRRYETANALARDIERHLEGEPVLACPPSLTYRLKRFSRKYRRPVAAAISVLATLVVGLVLAVFVRARQARQVAVAETHRAEGYATELEKQSQELTEQLYVSHMNLAFRAWKGAQLRQLRSLLDRHVPRTGQQDLRGFEWYYLRAILQESTPERTFDCAAGVKTIAYCASGRYLAVGLINGDVELHDLVNNGVHLFFDRRSKESGWSAPVTVTFSAVIGSLPQAAVVPRGAKYGVGNWRLESHALPWHTARPSLPWHSPPMGSWKQAEISMGPLPCRVSVVGNHCGRAISIPKRYRR